MSPPYMSRAQNAPPRNHHSHHGRCPANSGCGRTSDEPASLLAATATHRSVSSADLLAWVCPWVPSAWGTFCPVGSGLCQIPGQDTRSANGPGPTAGGTAGSASGLGLSPGDRLQLPAPPILRASPVVEGLGAPTEKPRWAASPRTMDRCGLGSLKNSRDFSGDPRTFLFPKRAQETQKAPKIGATGICFRETHCKPEL